ncbi:MAG: hypothetical protein QM704_15605 [Anaeromyxobacteraceae bacterium]
MLRTAVWTVGLFGAGAAIIGLFPQPWAQPLVLVALGIVFLWASARRQAPAGARAADRTGGALPRALEGQAERA